MTYRGYNPEDLEDGFHIDSGHYGDSSDFPDLEDIACDSEGDTYGASSLSEELSFSPEDLQRRFSMSYRDDKGDLRIEFYLDAIHIGYAIFSIIPGDIVWNAFHPLDNCLELEGNGIGTLAHVSALNYLSDKEFVDRNTYISHIGCGMNDSRLGHLRAMGILDSVQEPMLFEEYLEKSISYANSKGFHF